MAEVTWVEGTIDPPQSGEYYVTLEAKQDIINPVTGTVDYKTGDVMIYTDCYYAGDPLLGETRQGQSVLGSVVLGGHS